MSHRPVLLLCSVVTLALVACRLDRDLAAPQAITASVQDPQCSDPDPSLCGPVDGTIHDGTGDGTLVQVANDPAPGAPGVWLGHAVDGRYCYANFNSFIRDDDHDWLADDCEYQLAKAFAPALAMSPNDRCKLGEPYWAAKYFPNDPARNWGEFVRIAYMPAYYEDCSEVGENHWGDSEFLMIGLQYNKFTQHWEVRDAYLSAHAGAQTNSSDYVVRTNLEYPTWPLTYPRIWISRGKHANYISRDACNRGALGFDTCSDNQPLGRMKIYKARNAGSPFLDRFPSGVASRNAMYSQNGQLEYFYNRRNFKGWQATSESGVTPYHDYLFSQMYECFDYTYTFLGGTCYWGPGPSAPTWTYLTGVVDGPGQVTAYQTYTWSSFVTGGVLPYRAEWWRQYASQSAGTLVATSGSGTASFSAGAWTGGADRCENFTLTLKIWSADNQFWPYSRSVSVTCPPPPLSLSINGPGLITMKGTYTYTAITSGFSSPTFTWSERLCDNLNAASCSPWITVGGTGNTETRTLTPDCTGTGERNYQLHVVARNLDGRQLTADHTTALCSAAPK